jgi:glutaminyl-tRNA synthetase
VENPGADGEDFLSQLNPDSKKVVTGFLEPAAAGLAAGTAIQFERVGYFAVDPDSSDESVVFNRTVTLKDSWSKQQKK